MKRKRHKSRNRGNTHAARLDPARVKLARDLVRVGRSVRAVADWLGVSQFTVYHLLEGRTWRYVPDVPRERVIRNLCQSHGKGAA